MRIPMAFKTLALALCLAALCGCNPKQGSETGKPAKSAGQVLAEVNGTIITTDELKREIDTLPPYLKPMTESAEGRKEMLDTMVVRELILQQALKDGLDKSSAVADKMEDLKKRVLVEAFIKKKVEEQVNIGDAELQKFYDQNSDKFKTGEQIKASHILVKSEKDAKDILAKLKQGESFEELARKSSIDGSAAKGGDLGWFGSGGAMIPEFEKVAFALKEGQLSGIVPTQYGFHIIKMTGKRPAGLRPFAEVKDQIKAKLLPEKQQDVFVKLKEELKKTAKISIKEDALKGIDAKPAAAASVPASPSKP
ncbi:MAG: peptidylprolyl isomerase [Geobacteraceae bacterium]